MHHLEEHNCIDDNKLIAQIKEIGWSVLGVEATQYLPSFAYTVGLWKTYKHPEIIAFGFSMKTLHAILNIGGELAKEGNALDTYTVYDCFFESGKAKFINVDRRNLGDYFGYAIWYNEAKDFPAMQLVWTDRNNKYPWEEGFEEEFVYKQPMLDRNADFKFREAKNLGIFTTRQWLEQNKPILRVLHEDDGDWQFLTGDQMPEDLRLVCLEEMTKRDKTLNDIFNLDYGEAANRNSIGDKWERGYIEDEY